MTSNYDALPESGGPFAILEEMANPETELGGPGRRFPTTIGSIFRAFHEGSPAERETALQRLVGLYWKPVYCLIRHGWRKGNEDAKDLTQEFFTVILVERGLAGRFAPERGSFRKLLRTAVANFMRDASKAASREKRGGGALTVPLETADADLTRLIAHAGSSTPEELFDAAWKQVVMSKAVDLMEERLLAAGKQAQFDVFRRYELSSGEAPPSYADVGRSLGLSADQVKHALVSARGALRKAILDVVADYAGTEELLDAELNELFGL